MTPTNNDDQRKALLDFAAEQIRTKDDEGAQLLRAHLVAETFLYEILDEYLPNPRALDNARLTFLQLVSVIESLGLPGSKPWIWESLRKLNSLRNDFSHRLPRDRKRDLRASFIDSSTPWLYSPPGLSEKDQFEIRLFLLCGVLANIRHGMSTAGPAV